MILYRKVPQLRIRRAPAPEPPFWAATTIAPYGPRRATPLALDMTALRASAADRLEVTVSAHVRDELERTRLLDAPVLIESTGRAEEVFRRGEEALAYCGEQRLAAMQLVSTEGAVPRELPEGAVLTIVAWPLDLDALAQLFTNARGTAWGVAVPLLFPLTTELQPLARLASLAQEHGAHFLAGLPIAAEPAARQSIARSLALDGEDETYAMLFHADLEPIHVATERHLAALAAGLGMADFIVPPRFEERTNWNGAVLLTRTASRMMAMEHDLDLAAAMARSARVVAELDKPIARIAEAASLGIIGALDEASAEMLTEWLEGGTPGFAGFVDRKWRTRRDHGV